MAVGNGEEEAMKKILGIVAMVATVLVLLLAMPVSAEQEHGQKIYQPRTEGPMVCPAPLQKTGDASFDSFYAKLSRCRIVPAKHWWEFWKKSRPALRQRKTQKEPTVTSALFSIHRL
jgi:hypothetical protein